MVRSQNSTCGMLDMQVGTERYIVAGLGTGDWCLCLLEHAGIEQ